MRSRYTSSGQSLVEFALVVPIALFLLLAIADFARIYTTMITVESAAREAADYGALYPWYWDGKPDDDASNYAKTVQGMRERACLAMRNLPDYIGPDNACTNPSFSVSLDASPAGVSEDQCYQVARSSVPCNVEITLGYDFEVLFPVSIPFGAGRLGFPSTLSFERTSTFAISDFEIDEPLQPLP
jgi:Flp pilus assembly protein TadG